MPESKEFKDFKSWNGKEVTLDKDDKKYKAKAWIWDASQNNIWEFVEVDNDQKDAKSLDTNEIFEKYPEKMRVLNDYLESEIPYFIQIGAEETKPKQLLDLQAFNAVIGDDIETFKYYKKTFKKITVGTFLHVKFALFDNFSYSKRFAKFWKGEVFLDNMTKITSPGIPNPKQAAEPAITFEIHKLPDKPRTGLSKNKVVRRELTPVEAAIADNFTDPTEGKDSEVIEQLGNDNPKDVLFITRADMRRLQPVVDSGTGAWLNGNLVEMYMNMLQKRNDNADRTGTTLLNCRFAPIAFWDYMSQFMHNPQGFVEKTHGWYWSRAFKFGTHEMLLIPLNKSTHHFTLAVVNFKNRRYEYFDSLIRDQRFPNAEKFGMDMLTWIAEWVAAAWKERYGTEWTASDLHGDDGAWPRFVWKNVAQQSNLQDCGVFTLMAADYYARNAPLDFGQAEMPYFRRRIAVEIAQNQLFDNE